ncbi:MAG: Asp-tRNA(Asn)/Glu-tRNA(Gln) amidotransferase subunit GatB [Kiritimatiellaeota bacterium]|nr:Asp-tRNA(Asn)/Glu-tRNA(Gln) amidotransferase subunit GatB [Kiritimatiellota bacterium]
MSKYLVTVGLETHVHLKVKSKLWCGCSTAFGAEANANTCPGCLGFPGTLPVVNREAVRLAVTGGMMLGCEISRYSTFDRKSYFYPDIPKNYQITQSLRPFCVGGGVEIRNEELGIRNEALGVRNHSVKRIRIHHIHLEEDAAKINHYARFSGVDFNRGCMPMIEIVTEPDMSSREEVMAYLHTLRQILIYAGVSDCDMEKGQMRSDVNVSIRPEGQEKLGTRVEIKNMNTFKGIDAALEYEIARQIHALTHGGRLVQETRRWDPDAGETQSMRTKENAHDYRYFPDPDLVPVVLSEEQIETWRAALPELPSARRERMVREYGIPEYDAGVLADEKANADFFEAAARLCGQGKAVSNWFMTEIMRLLSETGKAISECAFTPEALAELVTLVGGRVINGTTAKELVAEIFEKGGMPGALVEARGLGQVSDTATLEAFVDKVIAENPKSVESYKAGKTAAAGFIVGQVMKLSQGKADPQIVGKLVSEKLANL